MRLFFVTDDREILANHRARKEEELFESPETEYIQFSDGRVVTRNKKRKPHVDRALEVSLATAFGWAREKVLTGSRRGEADASSLYAQVLTGLTTTRKTQQPVSEAEIEGLIGELEAQAVRSAEYFRFGIPTSANIGDLVEITRKVKDPEQRAMVVRILQPYVETLRARLDALGPVHESLDDFVRTINSFFVDKSVSFQVANGITIMDSQQQVIAPDLLSSGEKQLLLLFCNILVATGPSTIVFIDEPELSLNVKWQRRLARALLDNTRNRNIQFVLATHSFEILAQNRPNAVTLKHDGTIRGRRSPVPDAGGVAHAS